MKILVTGGAGFIGSAVVRHLIANTGHQVVVFDKLTYAGDLASLAPVSGHPDFSFVKADIGDAEAVRAALADHRPDAVMHLAAETHVDRSIDGPGEFVATNVVGTYTLLREATAYWSALPAAARDAFRFHHVSTDEVYGSLGSTGLFTETTAYDPRSPYSATKAASDHLVRAWHETYGLPTLVTNCSNNYGPYHFPEKLIPLMIVRALAGRPLPVYGDGGNVRDWLYVDDHARALQAVLERGVPGETYNVGGSAERRNIEVVRAVCAALDGAQPRDKGRYADLVTFVADRPGHDRRYAIDATKIRDALGWRPAETFESGIDRTVRWYLQHRDWWEPILARQYDTERLGLGR